MSRSGFLSVALCLVTIGCDQDPARSVKIIARPPEKATVTPVTAPAPEKATARPIEKTSAAKATSPPPDKSWHPSFCPPPEDAGGPSSFVASGPCAFQHREKVTCEPSVDDFIIGVARKAKDGATMVIYINVEHYHGPDDYDAAQVFVEVQSDTVIYRWSTEAAHVTVGPGGTFVTLASTRLEGEPVLIECTRLIGPGTNYQYQCARRSDEKLAIETTFEVVSGTLQCSERPKE